MLVKLGADLAKVRQQVIQLISGYQGAGSPRQAGTGASSQRQEGQPVGSLVLDQFGRNLTAGAPIQARPRHRREKEIER